MTLRSKLIVSYILIIGVCLFLAFVTFLLVARPLQNRLVSRQLIFQSRQAALRLNTLYGQGVSTEQIIARFNALDNNQGRFRLVLLDSQGTILADSQDKWQGQQFALPAGVDGSTSPQTGTFDTPGSGTFLYAVLPVGPEGRPVNYVAAVAPRPSNLGGLLAELGWGFIVSGVVAWLVSLVLGVLIARSIARPLQRIAAAASAVAAGDYEHRLEENGPPEIKRVASSFNLMMGQVKANQQAMRDFVSNVSHELKTPLTSIQGFSQAIMEGATQDEAARRRAAGIIHEEAGRMARMVEDLLDLARIESGQVVMHKTPLDLTQILSGTIDRLLPQAAQKQIKIVKQWNSLPQVVGDGDRLAQVFTNFLDNAVRHTPAGGQITITGQIAPGLPRPRRVRAGLVRPDATTTTSERGDFVSISIADSGPGIPPEDLGRIFERFYQVDKSRKRGRGTGLGLAITKEIVEAHGGYVRAESVESVGTKFTVLLPITEADALTVISPKRA